MSGTGRRFLIPLVILVLVAAATSGCFGRDRGGDGDGRGATGEADTITFTLLGVDPPEGADEVALNLTIDHIALFDRGESQWVPLLTDPATTVLLFSDGAGEAAFLVQVPLVPGDYEAIEVVASSARVITESGSTQAQVPRLACYAPIALGAPQDGTDIGLELWLSGPESLEPTNGGWRFQPALIGTVSGTDEGGAELVEPDCMPY